MGNAERDQVWDALVQRQLKKLPPPAVLGAVQLARIAQALDRADIKPRPAPDRRLGIIAVAAIVVAVVVGVKTLRHADNFVVPNGARAKLSTVAGNDIVVVGPAALNIGGPVPTIRKGRIVVMTDKQSETLSVPEGHVRIAAGSTVVVAAFGMHTRVEVYSGSAHVEWQVFPSAIEVGIGTVFSADGVPDNFER